MSLKDPPQSLKFQNVYPLTMKYLQIQTEMHDCWSMLWVYNETIKFLVQYFDTNFPKSYLSET